MNDRGWEELVDLIDQKFAITAHHKQEKNLPDEPTLSQQIETIIFDKNGEKYKIERITGPAVIDKKTFYHRTGASDHVKYVYDPDEIVNKVNFYHEEAADDWQEVNPQALLG